MPRVARPRWSGTHGRWYAKVGATGPDGRARPVYFPREIGPKDEAAAWEHFRSLVAEPEAPRPTTDPTTGELCLAYLEWARGEVKANRMSAAHWKSRRSHLKKWASHDPQGVIVAEKKASALSAADLDGFLQAAMEGLSPHYVADMARSILAVMNWAARPVAGRQPERILAENPLRGYRRPVTPRGAEGRYADARTLRRFARWCWALAREKKGLQRRSDRVALLMFRFLRLTGARPGEACRLEWGMIDWEDQVAVIPPPRHKTGKKTGRPRTIFLGTSGRKLLREIERLPGRHEVFVFTHRGGKGSRLRGVRPEAGEPWNTDALGKKIKAWRRAAIEGQVKGIADVGEERLVAYLLRHSYITDASLGGAPHATLAKLVGNSPRELERTYDHAVRSRLSEKAEEIARKRRGRR
jgi:integrase